MRQFLSWKLIASLFLMAAIMALLWIVAGDTIPPARTDTAQAVPLPSALPMPAPAAPAQAPAAAAASAPPVAGALPPQASREQVRQFVAAYQRLHPMALSTLSEDIFKGQPRSEPWAGLAESRIRTLLGRAPSVSRVRADCRSSLCRVEIERDASAHSWKIFPQDLAEGELGLVVTGLATSPASATFYLYSTEHPAGYPEQLASALGPLRGPGTPDAPPSGQPHP
jgi:hypothetical protein